MLCNDMYFVFSKVNPVLKLITDILPSADDDTKIFFLSRQNIIVISFVCADILPRNFFPITSNYSKTPADVPK